MGGRAGGQQEGGREGWRKEGNEGGRKDQFPALHAAVYIEETIPNLCCKLGSPTAVRAREGQERRRGREKRFEARRAFSAFSRINTDTDTQGHTELQ